VLFAAWTLLGAGSRADAAGAKTTDGPSDAQLRELLGTPARFQFEVGDPDDPRTWSHGSCDPETWRSTSLQPTDRTDIVSAQFCGAIAEDEGEDVWKAHPWGFQVTDAQVRVLTGVKTLRSLVFIQAGVTAQQLKTLTAISKLEVLDLRQSGATDEAMQWVGQMKDLRSLAIYDESIGAAGLKHLKGLPKLVFLDLAGEHLDDDALAGLSGLKSVKFLALNGNVTDAGLAALASFDSLEVLRFERRSSLGVHGSGLKFLPAGKLRELSLTEAMSDDGLAAVGRFTSLRGLDISGSPVTDKGIQSLHDLRSLEVLDAHSTKISGAGLENLTGLKRLVVYDTEITGAGLENLTGLKRLEAHDTKITSENMKSLANLKDLQYVKLGRTPIDGDGLKHLNGLRHLEHLDVVDTKIDNESLRNLTLLPSIQFLNLGGCAVDDRAAGTLPSIHCVLPSLSANSLSTASPRPRREENDQDRQDLTIRQAVPKRRKQGRKRSRQIFAPKETKQVAPSLK
jgi:Leucine-rich repeat (LRR) protein